MMLYYAVNSSILISKTRYVGNQLKERNTKLRTFLPTISQRYIKSYRAQQGNIWQFDGKRWQVAQIRTPASSGRDVRGNT
jgi:hypothetical protein